MGSGVVTRTIVTRGDGLLVAGFLRRRSGSASATGAASARARRVSSRTIRAHIHSVKAAKIHHCTAYAALRHCTPVSPTGVGTVFSPDAVAGSSDSTNPNALYSSPGQRVDQQREVDRPDLPRRHRVG